MIGAIIQARMGSTRLPGKVLMDLHGQPVLRRVLDRVAMVPDIEVIAVATSVNPLDNAIAEKCTEWDIPCYRGSEDDVLDRFYRAAALLELTTVVRITADCPLHDPAVITQVIQHYRDTGADYCSNVQPPTFPDGLDTEVVSITALEQAWDEAADPFEREHVMPYIRRRPDRFRITNMQAPANYSHLRWTLDTAEDLAFIRSFYEEHGSVTDWKRFLPRG